MPCVSPLALARSQQFRENGTKGLSAFKRSDSSTQPTELTRTTQPARFGYSLPSPKLEVTTNGPHIANSKNMSVRAAIDEVGMAFSIEPMPAAIAVVRLVPTLEP